MIDSNVIIHNSNSEFLYIASLDVDFYILINQISVPLVL